LNCREARVIDPISTWEHPVEVIETSIFQEQHDDVADPVKPRSALGRRRRQGRCGDRQEDEKECLPERLHRAYLLAKPAIEA
jgi:hypothetical protein